MQMWHTWGFKTDAWIRMKRSKSGYVSIVGEKKERSQQTEAFKWTCDANYQKEKKEKLNITYNNMRI